MVLESCMVLLDNSEYMRNGDYIPNRLEAQHDAANMIVGTKTQSNPESTVGVIAMTGEIDGSGAELLVSPTDDMGKILTALHGVPIRTSHFGAASDGSDITAAIQVASLALKHRRNKNGGQRVVVFVGSPLTADARALQRCGRQLKKNNIAIDVVCLGELEENEPLLQELVNAANGTGDDGANTCHLVTIPAGVLPSDVLVSSPIVAGSGAGMGAYGGSGGMEGGGGGGDAFAEYGGVDPNMDPELAMALRVSMEEERARQERLAAERAAAEGNTEPGAEGASGEAAEAKDGDEGMPDANAEGGDEEDALLQQALAMSMQEDNAAAVSTPASKAAAATSMETDEDEDAAMQMALAMSMQEDSVAAAASGSTESGNQFQDPAFVNQLLGSLPGVNPNDPAIQQALQNLQNKDGSTKDKKDSEDGSSKKDEE